MGCRDLPSVLKVNTTALAPVIVLPLFQQAWVSILLLYLSLFMLFLFIKKANSSEMNYVKALYITRVDLFLSPFIYGYV